MCDSKLEQWLHRYWTYVLLVILAGAILIRVIYFLELSSGPNVWQHQWPESDMNFFDRWARQIMEGDLLSSEVTVPLHSWHKDLAHEALRRYPDIGRSLGAESYRSNSAAALWELWCGQRRFYQEPAYPYLIAATYRLLGSDVRFVFAWQLVLGVGSIAMICIITRCIFGVMAGALSGILAALCSPMLFYEMVLLRATLIVFTGLALVLVIEIARRRGSCLWWGGVGLAMGVAILIKSYFVLMILGVLVVMLWEYWHSQERLIGRGATMLIGLAIGILPLVVRNQMVGASPLAFTSAGGVTFITSNTPDYVKRGPSMSLEYAPAILAQTRGAFVPTVWRTLRTHDQLWDYVKLLKERFTVNWQWIEIPNNCNFYYYRLWSRILSCLPVTFYILAPLGIVGVFLALPSIGKSWPLYLLIATHLVVVLIFFSSSRLRLPLQIAVIPFAAYLVSWAIRRLQSRHFRLAVVVLGCVTLTGLWTSGRWTATILPNSNSLIRWVDCMVPLRYFYGPRADEAISRGDWGTASELMIEAVKVEPPQIRVLDFHHRAADRETAMIGTLFARAHRNLSVILANNGSHRAAARYAQRAEELEAACRRQP